MSTEKSNYAKMMPSPTVSMSTAKSNYAKMAPPPPERGAFRIQTMEDGNILATPIKNDNMDTSPSHQHNQSTKKWEKASARIQLLPTLNM